MRVPSADNTYTDAFRFTVERQGFVRLDLTSTDFSPYLALFDARNRNIAVMDTTIPPPGAHIALGLEPGVYTLYANSTRSANGGFALAASFEEARPCPLNLYRLTVTEAAVYTIDMASNDFDTYLLIFDDQYRYIGEADDLSAGNTNSRLIASLSPGAYIVMANTYDGVGAYTLQVTSAPFRNCPVRDLAVPATVSGALAATACRVLDTVAPSADETPADRYRITLARPAVVSANLDSTDFDAWLVLAGPAGAAIADDDDSGGGTNSRIETLLQPGDYYVLANTTGDTGAYTLRTALRDAPSCPVAELNAGESAAGEIDAGACRLLEVLPGDARAPAVARYRVTLANRATLRVGAASPDFSPALMVLDGGNRQRGADARSLTSAEVAVPLDAGVYSIVLMPVSGDGGRFTLQTAVE